MFLALFCHFTQLSVGELPLIPVSVMEVTAWLPRSSSHANPLV